MPLLGDATHASMVAHMAALKGTLPAISAILVISAHWEERKATISTGSADRGLLFDYGGFPDQV
jgi:aromatic ring-opening dioxygenase catalytic subunit (LigB family)